MSNKKGIVVGNIQFGPNWEPFFAINNKINDRVALNMYKALKAVASNPDVDFLNIADGKALKKVHKAIQEYEASYNKN